MMILLRLTKSLMRAAGIQVVFFGLLHIKGADIPALIDSFSVMVIAVGFTYTAYKTRSLVAGIVFHFLHDSLLFFVQVPKGVHKVLGDNVLFYLMLWSMVGIGCLATKFAADKFKVCASTDLYTLKTATTA
jgi:membrane protease YdiL (CAAX protease family)